MSERSQNDSETIMPESNPYQAPLVLDGSRAEPNRKRNGWWLGFAVGAVPPAILGSYGYISFQIYVASLPPGMWACGNTAMESIFLVFVGAPICGMIGGMIGKILS
jgi:hypothetical protein